MVNFKGIITLMLLLFMVFSFFIKKFNLFD